MVGHLAVDKIVGTLRFLTCEDRWSHLKKNNKLIYQFTEIVGRIFSVFGLTPNQWTIISLLVVIVAAWFIVNLNFIAAAMLIGLSVFLDVVDGAVARNTGRTTASGGYFDTIVDRYIEATVIFALLFVELPNFLIESKLWLFAYFFGSFMTTYVKACAKEKDLIESELVGGFLGRAERMILLILGMLLAALSLNYLVYIIAMLAVLSNLSVLHRIKLVLSGSTND
ncbi:MAG: CDP-alcohol phosphatidyltransferase family protein [candidate division Zixibacteria bacterium]